MLLDFDRCYRAAQTRDPRFDGWFYVGVLTTGIYCRPICPAVTPKRANVRFFASAAAAQAAGLRACRRCRPDAAPGSPEWDVRGDLAARAMRLIGDGLVDRAGVRGLADRLGFSERHLHRLLVAEVGAGPLALARAQRAQVARLLLEQTDLGAADVAFAAGFGSVRQFNDTVRAVYAATPSELRAKARRAADRVTGRVALRLACREPLDRAALLEFLAARAVPGVEQVTGETYRRSLRLPHGPGVVELTLSGPTGAVGCVLHVTDVRDVATAAERCRRLLDLDADPEGVADALGADPVLGPLVEKRPGLRVPGSAEPAETAVRAVLGQQVSLAAARTLAGRLVAAYGEPLAAPVAGVTHLFPEPAALAEAGDDLPMPRARQAALRGLARALAGGDLVLDAGADWTAARDALDRLPGIGEWTREYVLLRALSDPDAFPAADGGLLRAAATLGVAGTARELTAAAEAWRPFRAYAAQHLWSAA